MRWDDRLGHFGMGANPGICLIDEKFDSVLSDDGIAFLLGAERHFVLEPGTAALGYSHAQACAVGTQPQSEGDVARHASPVGHVPPHCPLPARLHSAFCGSWRVTDVQK